MKTPVWVPRIVRGVMPASSSASQATSRSRRCCGSIAAASRGEMAKNSASNSSGCQEVRNPPSRLQIVGPTYAPMADEHRNRKHQLTIPR